MVKKWNWIVLALLSVLFLSWSMRVTQFDWSALLDIEKSWNFLKTKWFPPDWSVLPLAFKNTGITLAIAFLGTFLAVIAAIPVSFLAAYNTSPKGLYHLIRSILTFIRTIPEIVLGLIFIATFGLGPFPAVIAIMVHNIGVLGKLISELVESSDRGPVEAITSVGAKKTIIALYGILPQILPNILSHYFYRFEVAIRTSLILGLIGGGGLGNMLFIDYKIFNYTAVTAEVVVFMVLVFLVDYLSTFVRKKVI